MHTKQPHCARKSGNCIHRNQITLWGGVATVALIIASIVAVLIDANNPDLNGPCTKELTLDQVSECTNEKYHEDFLKLYRDKVDEKLLSEVTCGHGFAEVYAEFLEEVDAERFPELYNDYAKVMAEVEAEQAEAEQSKTEQSSVEPIYYAASAVVVKDKAKNETVQTVGPTSAYLERNPKKVWVPTNTLVSLTFYHNFFASVPLVRAFWGIERDFLARTEKYDLSSTFTMNGAPADWDDGHSYIGRINLLAADGIFYRKIGSSVRDYLEYPVRDSYKIKFREPGNYQFCEKVSGVGQSEELTRVCVEIRARDE